MVVLEYAVETIVGTLVMTLFSYLVSASFRKLFTEPVLINYVFRLSDSEISPKLTSALGWVLHFIAGLLFVIPYHWLWNRGIFDPDWSLWLGAISGIIGIIAWMIIFSLPRKEPRVAFTQYYVQLFFAHIFFAVTVCFVHKLFV